MKSINCHTIWVSDLHIGSIGFKEKRFYDFLNSISCNKLFILGDLLELWLINNCESIKKIIRALKQLKKKGIEITIITGNHDHAIQKFKPDFCEIKSFFIYKAIKGKKFLLIHGDKVLKNKKKEKVVYENSKINKMLYKIGYKINKKYADLFIYIIKYCMKKIYLKLKNFKNKLVYTSKQEKVDGIIYGHTHIPTNYSYRGYKFYNPGDWLYSCTYLQEDHKGNIKLKRF